MCLQRWNIFLDHDKDTLTSEPSSTEVICVCCSQSSVRLAYMFVRLATVHLHRRFTHKSESKCSLNFLFARSGALVSN